MNPHVLNRIRRILLAIALTIVSVSTCKAGSDSKPGAVDNGKWGGTHVEMQVTPQGATLEFDCAEGTISEPLLLDASGKFQAKGTFLPQHGGPTTKDDASRNVEVVYSGTMKGDTLEIEFTLHGEDSPEKFTIVRGKAGILRRCA
jgi:hypothetical protein